MDNVIHAHVLMDFILTNQQLSSLEEIKKEFTIQFGDVRFTNCTNNIYTFNEIIEFLSKRNKILFNTNGIEVNEVNICKDD